MKVILTGSTGFVGSEVLRQCIETQEIESLVVLTRRSLGSDMKTNKVNNIVMGDFKSYSSDIIDKLSDADACIWCLGGSIDAEIDFPLAFTQAITQDWISRDKPFHYVHCSGVLAEKDQTKSLWFMQDGRRAKGQAETLLTDFAANPSQRDLWQTYIMRPSMVMSKQPTWFQSFLGLLLGSVKVDELANAAIQLATHAHNARVLENKDLEQLGKQQRAR